VETKRKPSFGIANLSGLLAALWVLLAWINQDTTYHVAPLLVAAAFPIGHRLRIAGPLRRAQSAATLVGAALNVGVAIGILAWADKLQGPSLLPTGGAVLESVVFGALGAVVAAAAVALPVRLPGDAP
jgi:hypothetical protein